MSTILAERIEFVFGSDKNWSIGEQVRIKASNGRGLNSWIHGTIQQFVYSVVVGDFVAVVQINGSPATLRYQLCLLHSV